MLNDELIIEDEIDIGKYIKLVWDQRKKIMICLAICIIFTSIMYGLAPKKYRATATFFIKSDSSSQFNPGFGIQSLLMPQVSNSPIGQMIEPLSESERMISSLIENMMPYLRSREWINSDNEEEAHSSAVGILKLDGLRLRPGKVGGFYKVSYVHVDNQLTVALVNTYIETLTQITADLDLTAHKRLFTILDVPTLPKHTSLPRYRMYFLLGVILGIGSGISWVIGDNLIKKLR